VSAVVVPFVRETHGDAIVAKGPQFLDQPVVEFPRPFAREEFDDLRTPDWKLRSIAPRAVFSL
jgi:hypothetical protein